MSRSRDAVIAVTATIFFGVFSRVTVRIPYMVWGYFDESFFISFVWWLSLCRKPLCGNKRVYGKC